MIYLEFSDYVVNHSTLPSNLCCVNRPQHEAKFLNILQMAERAYHIEGNELTEIKNRYSTRGTMYISDEDKVVLKLRAVLL